VVDQTRDCSVEIHLEGGKAGKHYRITRGEKGDPN
jgi:hypothetical protein